MKELTQYIDQINFKRSLFGASPLDIYSDYVEVSEQIELLGSPEILSMDVELSREEVEQRTNMWLDAMAQLKEIEQELV